MVFEYPSNFSNGTAVIDLGTFAQYSNYLANNSLGIAFLTVIFFITFVSGLALSANRAILFSSFVTFIFSVLFVRLDLIPPYIPFVLLAFTILGAVLSKAEGRM
jgi:hypothetical protein|tara:strand:- start:35 stop:346 length:312 start_codon:yes stop_codon:yes gene_type:complete